MSPMMQLLARTTAAFTVFPRKAAGPDLFLLPGGGGEGGAGSLTGERGAAALEVQRIKILINPSSLTVLIRANMAKRNGTDPNSPQDMNLCFEKNGRFAGHMKE